jgi:hypothetical protein
VLRFDRGTGKLVNIAFYPLQPVRWDRQLAYMKQKFVGDEPDSQSRGANTYHQFKRSRINVEVKPDGTLEYITVY